MGRSPRSEAVLGDSCDCHGHHGLRAGRYNCQCGVAVHRGGLECNPVDVDLDRECLSVGDRGLLVILIIIGRYFGISSGIYWWFVDL